MVQIAIEVVASPTNEATTPKDQTPEIDAAAPSFEEGASIECNLSGIADDEDREPTDEEEPITDSRETAPAELPTITIDRRSRTLPTFGVNGIATINYLDSAPLDKDKDSAGLRSITTEVAPNCQESTEKESLDGEKRDNDVVTTSPKQTIASSLFRCDSSNILSIMTEEEPECQESTENESTEKESVDEQKQDNNVVTTSSKQTIVSSLFGPTSKYVVRIAKANTSGKPRVSNNEVNETTLTPYPVEICGKGTKSTDMESEVAAPSQLEEGGVEYEGITDKQTEDKSEEKGPIDAENETEETKNDGCANAGSETDVIKNEVSAVEPPIAPLPEAPVKMEDVQAEQVDSVPKYYDEASVEEEPVAEPPAPVESVQPAPSFSKIYDAITSSSNEVREENVEPQEEIMDDPSVEIPIEVSNSIIGDETNQVVSKSRGRASALKARVRVHQFKSLAKSTATASSRRLSSTSKSFAESSKSLISNVRARSKSRSRSSVKSHDVTNKDSEECVPFDQSAAATETQLSVQDEKEETPIVEDKDVVKTEETTTSSDDVKLAPTRSDVESIATRLWRLGEALVSPKASTANEVNEFKDTQETEKGETIDEVKETQEPEKEETSVEEVVTKNTDADTATNPISPIKSPAKQGGFMSRFFTRMSDDLFCKTDLDYTNFCGGVANVSSPVAVDTGVTLQTIQRAIASPACVNAVEVKPLFDQPEPADIEPVTAGEEEDKPTSKSTDNQKQPVKPINAISTTIEPAPSIDLQTSSLLSTKSSKSLKLITEVQSQPSIESLHGTPTAIGTVTDAATVNSNTCEGVDTTAINSITSPVACEQPRTMKKLRVDTLFLKKQDQPQTDNSAKKGDPKDTKSSGGNVQQAKSFNLAKSFKSSLKNLSPRGSDMFKSFKRSKGTDDAEGCLSPVVKASTVRKPSDPDLAGIRIYGGGITDSTQEKTQYPKVDLRQYRRRTNLKKELSRRASRMKESAMTMNKVLQHTMVKASQPKVKAIMTNHVHHRREQDTNRLY